MIVRVPRRVSERTRAPFRLLPRSSCTKVTPSLYCLPTLCTPAWDCRTGHTSNLGCRPRSLPSEPRSSCVGAHVRVKKTAARNRCGSRRKASVRRSAAGSGTLSGTAWRREQPKRVRACAARLHPRATALRTAGVCSVRCRRSQRGCITRSSMRDRSGHCRQHHAETMVCSGARAWRRWEGRPRVPRRLGAQTAGASRGGGAPNAAGGLCAYMSVQKVTLLRAKKGWGLTIPGL